eukprot:COSAG05_NODE_31_length_28416_cov_170.150652_15_plen_300_part_00
MSSRVEELQGTLTHGWLHALLRKLAQSCCHGAPVVDHNVTSRTQGIIPLGADKCSVYGVPEDLNQGIGQLGDEDSVAVRIMLNKMEQAHSSGSIRDLQQYQAAMKSTMRRAFEALDRDHSGQLTHTELNALLSELTDDTRALASEHHHHRLSEARSREIFAELDKDGSGSISFAEFESWWDGQDQVVRERVVAQEVGPLGELLHKHDVISVRHPHGSSGTGRMLAVGSPHRGSAATATGEDADDDGGTRGADALFGTPAAGRSSLPPLGGAAAAATTGSAGGGVGPGDVVGRRLDKLPP